MSGPRVILRLGEDGRVYQPGDTLAGQYRIMSIDRDDIKSLELSVLWYTDGKGDEDLGVHHFVRLSTEDGDWIDPRRPGTFETVLPKSPLSYDGRILKVRWCVRVRVFLTRGREVVGQRLFRLGNVPKAAGRKKDFQLDSQTALEGPQDLDADQTGSLT